LPGARGAGIFLGTGEKGVLNQSQSGRWRFHRRRRRFSAENKTPFYRGGRSERNEIEEKKSVISYEETDARKATDSHGRLREREETGEGPTRLFRAEKNH